MARQRDLKGLRLLLALFLVLTVGSAHAQHQNLRGDEGPASPLPPAVVPFVASSSSSSSPADTSVAAPIRADDGGELSRAGAGPGAGGDMQWRQRDDLRSMLEDYFSTPRHPVTTPADHDRARAFIKAQLEAAGLEVRVQEFPSAVNYPVGHNTSVTGANVIGILKGRHWDSTEARSDKLFVVGAHYDTTPESDGVDNNGSGVAALLALARRLRARSEAGGKCLLAHTVILVAFDLQLREHEPSSIATTGSAAFVRNFLGPRLRPSSTATATAAAADSSSRSSVFGGAVILDSVMNWNDSRNTQVLGPGFDELFPDVYQSVVKRDYRGDFVVMVSESGRPEDEVLAADVADTWKKVGGGGGGGIDDDDDDKPRIRAQLHRAAIDPSRTTSTSATATLLHFVQQDHASFWNYYPTDAEHVHLPAVLLTDTGIWRNKPAGCRTGSGGGGGCDTGRFIADEKLQFLNRTVDTLEAFLFRGECHVVTDGGPSTLAGSRGISQLVLGLASFLLLRVVAVQ